MSLPTDVIRKIDALIGTTSRPHMLDRWFADSPVDTGCLEWLVPEERGTRLQPSQALKDAIARTNEVLQRERSQDLNDSRKRYAELFSQEPRHIQDELAQYLRVEQKACYTRLNPFQKIDWLLRKVRRLLSNLPFLAYKGNLDCTGSSFELSSSDRIVVASTTDQFDIPRIERTMAENYSLWTEDIIDRLRGLDAKYGIDITGASDGSVEFGLKRIPKGNQARELGAWLLGFCPDAVGHQVVDSFPAGKVALWWD